MSASITLDTVPDITKQLQALASSAAAARAGVDQWVEEPSTDDWHTLFKVVDDSTLHFRFTKSFPAATKTVEQTVETMWENEKKLTTYRADEDAKGQALRLVKELSGDAYVFERDLVNPVTGTTATTTYVRVKQSAAIGTASVSPSSENVWANSLLLWTEFQQHNQGFAVTLVGQINLDDPKNAQRNIAELQRGTRKWEQLTI